ncbi:hypothetical protein ACGFIF_44280 [Kribbella sp. NPDC049174]|uniref:hypothetical protein n=1 Tax=Kribbella sp. NPDC049174 TaxID=3364112 RepID=UPI00371600EF
MGSGVGSPDADVVEPAVHAQGDDAGVVDLVGADAVVDLAGPVGAGGGFGAGVVGGGRGGLVRQRPMRAAVVVLVAQSVEQHLEVGDRDGWVGWARSHFFIVCLNRSTLPQVVGWLGREFFWTMFRRRSSVSRPLRPPFPPDSRVL